MTWIQTYTGKAFRLSDIKVNIDDIAHHLSTRCRFNGACDPFYSVAEHSVRMSRIAADLGYGKEVEKWCLFHDSAEAYLPDVSSPYKKVLRWYDPEKQIHHSFKWVEDQILEVVASTFNIRFPMDKNGLVKSIDNKILATEKRDLMCEPPEPWMPLPEPFEDKIEPWAWYSAKQYFLNTYSELFNG